MGLRMLWALLKTATESWIADNAPRLGAALSYYTVFAVSPLFIIVIFIASLWFKKASVQAALFGELANLVGPQGAKAFESALLAAAPHDQGKLAGAIAVGTLLLSATGLFMELQAALNAIWGVEEKSGQGIWGFVKNRLLSFAMVVGIGFLLLVSLVISAAVASAAKYLGALAPGLGFLTIMLNWMASFVVITLLFAMIFKVLPDVKISWREVWIGAVVTALLFSAGKLLLGLYLGRSSTVSAYGAAGSLVLILLWVYYSSQILFFGAELTQAYANRYGQRLQPKENAQWRTVAPPTARPLAGAAGAAPKRDRKAELLSELREQVESMRAAALELRHTRQKRRKTFGYWRASRGSSAATPHLES